MFQNFEDIGGPAHGAKRVAALREELARRSLGGFLVPRADEYQNEYVPACAERLLWLTGFSGSWGLAAVLPRTAALFVDGRYTLQAAAQTDPDVFTVIKAPDVTPEDWLADNLRPAEKLGFDPRLHTIDEVKRLTSAAVRAEAEFVAVDANPLDAVWTDRPAPPMQPLELQPVELAGRTSGEKIAEVRETLRKDKQDAVVLTALDSIAWLFNIRGSDLPHTPFVLSHAIVPASGKAWFFIEGAKLSLAAHERFSEVAEIFEPRTLPEALNRLGREKAKVWLDPSRTAQWFADRLAASGAAIVEGQDPCLLPKARKTAAETEGARAAHRRDGLAMCRFLAWFDGEAAKGALDEIAAAERLEAFRRESPDLREISFDTIAGGGPNGAIVHYRVTRSTNRRIEPGSLFLIDSGGQYRDGTTDITRTLAVGEPSAEMRRHFTLVLKGHIAIATARFPKGTRGCDLDAFARRALWEAGLDYDHGTGHGVGSYLSVHEGPQGLSKRAPAVLESGMILSNEPGYYREGQYGIRIENLILVKEPEAIPGGERPMMAFETLTLAPFDQRLIEPGLLTPEEAVWIDAYHARVAAELAPDLDETARGWLAAATAPLRT